MAIHRCDYKGLEPQPRKETLIAGCRNIRGAVVSIYSSIKLHIQRFIINTAYTLGFTLYYYYSSAMEETIIKLLANVAHQEEEISSLSAELYIQQKELNKLKQQMAALVERFRSFSEVTDDTHDKSPEPPPPHY